MTYTCHVEIFVPTSRVWLDRGSGSRWFHHNRHLTCWHHEYYGDGLAQDCCNSIAGALELLQSCAKPWYRYLQHPPRYSTADMRRLNSAIIIVADVLAPDSHQVINNNHADSVVTTGSHGSSVHGMQHSCHTTPIKQTTYMIKGGHGVNKLLVSWLLAGSFSHGDIALWSLIKTRGDESVSVSQNEGFR